jgi:hypothetical protein
MTAQEARDKMADLLGRGWQADFSEAIGIHPVSLTKQLTYDRLPEALSGHIEWLRATPVADWPARWHKLAARAAKASIMRGPKE